MRQPATRITQNLGNCNRKKDRTAVRFSSVLWIFSVHRTEPANTSAGLPTNHNVGVRIDNMNEAEIFLEGITLILMF
jgi:hypothetical protein